MEKVFVSYSHSDKDIAFKFADALDSQKIPYWLDSQIVTPGSSISDILSNALSKSNAVIFLLSENFKNSSWQATEIALALSGQKRVFPVLISENVHVPILLQQYAYIDASKLDDFTSVVIKLKEALTNKDVVDNPISSRFDLLNARKSVLEKEKEIYLAANILKENEMKFRAFSLSFISLCISAAIGLILFGGGIEHINFVWAVSGIFVGAATVEVGHLFRKTKNSGKGV